MNATAGRRKWHEILERTEVHRQYNDNDRSCFLTLKYYLRIRKVSQKKISHYAALPEHTPGSGVAQSLGVASSMFAAATNTVPVLPTIVGASSVGKHHCRLSSM